MGRLITRRDFLDGLTMAAGGALLAPAMGSFGASLASAGPEIDPPARGGLRGDHEGSYEVAHRLRDGAFWDSAGAVVETGEAYDLVVVGAGISGLAAAYFYRRHAAASRILVLDNHDDFGGHARRNEFRLGGRLWLSYGGTQSIESPSEYSAVAKGLLRELGVDPQRFYSAYDRRLYRELGLGTGVFFDKEAFGADRLAAGMGERAWPELLAVAPLSEKARREISRIYTERVDYLPGLSVPAKRERLRRISYADFLTRIAGLDEEALPFFQTLTHDLYAVGIDAVPALECAESGDDYGIGYPGFQGLGLGADAGARRKEPYIFHFPDGNASIARLLVRALVPEAAEGHTMEDIVTASVRYPRLDDERSAVRIRLNSTVVRVRHRGDSASAREVELAYVRSGRTEGVRAKAVVLACWSGVIPYLCPELPESQREALAYGVKAPLVYTQVLVRSWQAFRALKVHQIHCPGSYYSWVSLDFPVSLGAYRCPRRPEEPMVVFMLRTPCRPGLPAREQHRAGRAELLATPFDVFERKLRDQLGRMLGPAGFDPARDVAAITVNRWAHGYAYSYNPLFDPDFTEDARPCVVGRKPFGRIAIANSDAAASAYTDAAIDEAHRAVQEVLPA